MIVCCPHCNQEILIEKINCGIFRCGQHKKTGKHIPPHASKKHCDKIKKSGEFYGCTRPFKVVNNDTVVKCEYNV
jgi:hypothetical protein